MTMLIGLTATYNLPFTILLVLCMLLCLLFGVLQLVGLGGEAEHGVDADADLHPDHDADHDSDAESNDMSSFSVLAFLGVGKAPIAVVLILLLGAIGIVGLMLNSVVASITQPYPALALVGIMPISLIVGGFISSRISRLIGRALPPISTTSTRAQALVGKGGVVISLFVDGKYGMVRLRDRGATQINVFATSIEPQPLARGHHVTLESYDESKKQFRVSKQ